MQSRAAEEPLTSKGLLESVKACVKAVTTCKKLQTSAAATSLMWNNTFAKKTKKHALQNRM
jgi:hypothetical protein